MPVLPTSPAPSESTPSIPSRVRYQVLAMVCGLSMITYLDRVCFGTAAPAIASELNLTSVADMKWVFTAFAIAYAIFEIPTGWWGDRIGPKKMLIRIVAWWSICTALTAVVGWKWAGITFGGLGTLITLRFLFGAGEAGAYPNIASVLRQWIPRHQWELAQGLVWMSGRIAGGLTPLIWALLVSGTAFTPSLMHWRTAFVLFGIIGLIWCVIFSIQFRNRPQEHPNVNQEELAMIGTTTASPATHHGPVPWKALLTNRSLWALCLMYSLINYGWAFNITYLPSYMEERFEVPRDDLIGAIYKGAPLWVGAIGCVAGGILVNTLSRRLGSRALGRRALGVMAMLLCAACWIGAREATNVHLFCLFVAASGFGIDLTLGAAWATCQDLGRRNTAVVAACMNTIGTLGTAFATWITGTVIQSFIASKSATLQTPISELSPSIIREATLSGYQAVFLTTVGGFLIAAVCWLLIDPDHVIDTPEHSDPQSDPQPASV